MINRDKTELFLVALYYLFWLLLMCGVFYSVYFYLENNAYTEITVEVVKILIVRI